MLIKHADDPSDFIRDLEHLATGSGPEAKRAEEELRIRKAGLKGESESAYLIDFDFGKSANWAVIHDLRLEHSGRVAQIDHLLVNRWMDMYVLETKHFHAGLKITEDGEFVRWNSYRRRYEGMASPLEQNERHIQVLQDVIDTIALPTRLGLRIAPSFHTLVLVSAKATIYRPRKFDASRVIKADQLKKTIWRDIDNENALVGLFKAAKIVSSETVEYVAQQLAAKHRPLRAPQAAVAPVKPSPAPASTRPASAGLAARDRIEPVFARPAQPPAATGPACKDCAGREGAILHGKYGYYFKCKACSGNTAIRVSCKPGHNARVRKDGEQFYQECADCKTSQVFHRNMTDAGAR